MSVSAIFGTGLVTVFASPPLGQFQVPKLGNGGGLGMVIECSRGRRRQQPWDIKRKPTVYAPLPPDWTSLALSSDDSSATSAGDLVSGTAA
ncbi:hypothetical protein Bca52824_023286 [Brassica carinata]|uniref:Uncharacterized protein n=1 Tax=Brassica carinata TaxID=52824 RepID=A0A8X7VHW4_BRACI|nr:hypothetical protein Bca52824_023286 [Brassica carinata]